MLSLKIQKLGDVTLVHCVGRIVFPFAGEFLDAISRQLPSRTLVLDLGDVIGIDAAGLGALVSLWAGAKETGIVFKLMNVPPRVEKLLRLTKLDSVLEVCSAPEILDLLGRSIHNDESARFQPMGIVASSLSLPS